MLIINMESALMKDCSLFRHKHEICVCKYLKVTNCIQNYPISQYYITLPKT